MRISKHIKDFLEYLEITKNRSEKTIQNYSHYLNRFKEFLGEEMDPKNISLQKVNNYRIFLNRFIGDGGKTIGIKTQNFHERIYFCGRPVPIFI